LVAEQNVGFAVSFAGSAPAAWGKRPALTAWSSKAPRRAGGAFFLPGKVRGGRALFAKLVRRQCSKAVWVGCRFFWFSNFGILKILLGQAAQSEVLRVRWR